jgi:hypothetical protein
MISFHKKSNQTPSPGMHDQVLKSSYYQKKQLKGYLNEEKNKKASDPKIHGNSTLMHSLLIISVFRGLDVRVWSWQYQLYSKLLAIYSL